MHKEFKARSGHCYGFQMTAYGCHDGFVMQSLEMGGCVWEMVARCPPQLAKLTLVTARVLPPSGSPCFK